MRKNILVLLSCASLFVACGQQNPETSRAAAELEALREQAKELPQLQSQNEEVQRLRQATRDLPRLRGKYQTVARLRKENDQLRHALAKREPTDSQPATKQ